MAQTSWKFSLSTASFHLPNNREKKSNLKTLLGHTRHMPLERHSHLSILIKLSEFENFLKPYAEATWARNSFALHAECFVCFMASGSFFFIAFLRLRTHKTARYQLTVWSHKWIAIHSLKQRATLMRSTITTETNTPRNWFSPLDWDWNKVEDRSYAEYAASPLIRQAFIIVVELVWIGRDYLWLCESFFCVGSHRWRFCRCSPAFFTVS